MLSIIIVTYNNEKEIRDCLNSIKLNTDQDRTEIIVVDNQSKDKTREILKKDYSQVKLVTPQKNLGFGKGNNLGIQHAQGQNLLFLNPDTIVINNITLIIENFFKKQPKAGIVGLHQLNKMGENRVENIGYDPKLLNLLFGWARKRPNYNKLQDVEQVSGAGLAIRRNLFEDLGGFDSDYFMYFEDSDLCYRVRKKGYKVYYHPKPKIFHLCGKSFSSEPHKKQLYYQSQDVFYQKHYHPLHHFLMKIFRWPIKLIKAHTL